MAGTKISEATLREQLKGTENIPIVDTDLPKGRTTVEKLKEYIGAGGVGEDVSGKEFTIDGEQVTAQGGAEVFNKGGTGIPNIAVGTNSHAEGMQTTASGPCSHAEGYHTTASGEVSHAEGEGTQAKGATSHSEGYQTITSENAQNSHAEGYMTQVNAPNAHAEGMHTKAYAPCSHAEGGSTRATNPCEHAEGQYNKSNTGIDTSSQTLHSIGIGTSENDRKNAFEVMQNGDVYLYGAGGYDGTNPGGEGVKTVQTQLNEIGDKMDKAGGEFTGTIAAPIVAFMRESQGMMGAIQADSNNILFRTYNAGVDSITFQVQNSMPLKLTEAGIWENNQLLENKYAKIDDVPNVSTLATKEEVNAKLSTETYNADKATFATKTELDTKLDTSTYNSDKESFATKTELSAKVGGTGVTAIKVVSALPDPQEQGVLYIVTGEEA